MRYVRWAAAATCIFLCSFHQAYCDSTGYEMPDIDKKQIEIAEKYIVKGVYYTEKKAYAMALSEFRNAVKISPEFFNARYNIARVYLEMGKTSAAAGQLKMINDDFKDNIVAYNMLGQIFVEMGKEKEAVRHFETAVRNGEALLEKVEIAQAKIDIAMAYHNLGSMQVKAGDMESALENLKKSVEANDSNYYSHYALGSLLVKMKKFIQAREELEKARELKAGFVEADIELARANLLSNPPNVMRAISVLREAGRKAPKNPQICELLGNCYIIREKTSEELKLNDYTEAMKYYRKALNLDKSNPRYRVLLARACALAGEHDTAVKVLEKLKKNEEELPARIRKEVHLVDAHIFKAKEKWAEAAGEYKKAFEIDPGDYAACLEAGKSYYRAKDFENAEKYLETVLDPFGDNPPNQLREKIEEAREMLLEIRKPQ